MTEQQSDKKAEDIDVSVTPPLPRAEAEHAVYLYKSSGIEEHKGRVPMWLWVVAGALVIWGIYYLIAYWNVPAAP